MNCKVRGFGDRLKKRKEQSQDRGSGNHRKEKKKNVYFPSQFKQRRMTRGGYQY